MAFSQLVPVLIFLLKAVGLECLWCLQSGEKAVRSAISGHLHGLLLFSSSLRHASHASPLPHPQKPSTETQVQEMVRIASVPRVKPILSHAVATRHFGPAPLHLSCSGHGTVVGLSRNAMLLACGVAICVLNAVAMRHFRSAPLHLCSEHGAASVGRS